MPLFMWIVIGAVWFVGLVLAARHVGPKLYDEIGSVDDGAFDWFMFTLTVLIGAALWPVWLIFPLTSRLGKKLAGVK